MYVVAIVLAVLVAAFFTAVYVTTIHPAQEEPIPAVCGPDAPSLRPGQELKVLSWNVQFMAGTSHFFFYELPDGSGPDERPSRESIETTLREVARVIRDESPDIVLLQEVDDGARRTDGEDQLARLLSLLPNDYVCHAATFYWKASFVPHPRIRGSVGMKLAVISRYRLDEGVRHRLVPISSDGWLTRQFNLKRAIQEMPMPMEGGRSFALLNTHLSAFAQGTDTLARQIAQVQDRLSQLSETGSAWLIGGDFNQLPSDSAYGDLSEGQRYEYSPATEIVSLSHAYTTVPAPAATTGPGRAAWYTYQPNGPDSAGPDRTLDYFFLAPGVQVLDAYVRRHDTRTISDHLPLVVRLRLPD